MPFFAESSILELTQQKPESTEPKCGLCKLYKGCNSPKMKVHGNGKRKILILGEAPGEKEDEKGKPFVGKTGKYLRSMLKEIGINMQRDCWATNSLICRPPHNRTPSKDEIEWCRPNLTNALKEFNPIAVVAVGRAAIESIFQNIWTEGIGPIGRWVGWKIPCRELNTWILPIWHPSYIQRELSAATGGTAIEEIYTRHIAQIKTVKDRPYDSVPDLEKEIELILNPNAAAKIIKEFTDRGWPSAFDYETNMLKPDATSSDIVAASICFGGRKTIAFPFQGEKLIKQFKHFLQSPCPKIGHNLKFEDRWSFKLLNVQVNNWIHDTMVSAHIVDNRRGICSLSFQGFVNLGIGSYSNHISPLLYQKRSYAKNRIMDIDLEQLLFYNGLDSYITYHLAVKQAKLLGVKLK
jgi:uracil-DNA glycosylase family 4